MKSVDISTSSSHASALQPEYRVSLPSDQVAVPPPIMKRHVRPSASTLPEIEQGT